MEVSRAHWGKAIIIAVVIGLAIGLSLWLWQKSSPQNAENRLAGENANRLAPVEVTKPVVLGEDLPQINRDLEPLGDKLAEAVLYLREQNAESAQQALNEAFQLADKAGDDRDLQAQIKDTIKQAQNSIVNGKFNEADLRIDDLMKKLDMPTN